MRNIRLLGRLFSIGPTEQVRFLGVRSDGDGDVKTHKSGHSGERSTAGRSGVAFPSRAGRRIQCNTCPITGRELGSFTEPVAVGPGGAGVPTDLSRRPGGSSRDTLKAGRVTEQGA